MNTKIIISIVIGVIVLIIFVIAMIVFGVSATPACPVCPVCPACPASPAGPAGPTGPASPAGPATDNKVTGRDYTFNQGVDSTGNDITQAKDYANKVSELKSKCDDTPKCVGFNTNGWLKHTINPPATWSKWTADPDKGLYISKN